MPLDTIASIAYKNSWDGSQGPMHTSLITFASGLAGEANHKQPTPPYRVGEVVEYQITGEFRGTNKLKVGKPKDGQQGGYQQPPQSSPPPSRENAGNGQQSRSAGPIYGATVGMAINQACEFARAGGKGFDKAFIYETASALLRLSAKLEMGQLAPLAGQPAPAPQPDPPPPQQFHTPPSAATAAFANASRPRPGPEGSAFPQDSHPDFEASEVPF